MLDEQHVATPAELTEEDVRRIVRSELEHDTGPREEPRSSPRRGRSTGPIRR